jgi:hypothetical protein
MAYLLLFINLLWIDQACTSGKLSATLRFPPHNLRKLNLPHQAPGGLLPKVQQALTKA